MYFPSRLISLHIKAVKWIFRVANKNLYVSETFFRNSYFLLLDTTFQLSFFPCVFIELTLSLLHSWQSPYSTVDFTT